MVFVATTFSYSSTHVFEALVWCSISDLFYTSQLGSYEAEPLSCSILCSWYVNFGSPRQIISMTDRWTAFQHYISDPVWQKGTYSLSNYTALCVCNFIIVTDICLKFSHTILLWWCGIVCKYHCKRPFSKKVMSSQSWKSGKVMSPSLTWPDRFFLYVIG